MGYVPRLIAFKYIWHQLMCCTDIALYELVATSGPLSVVFTSQVGNVAGDFYVVSILHCTSNFYFGARGYFLFLV